MDNMQRRLEEARTELLSWQDTIRTRRSNGLTTGPNWDSVISCFYRAIDRAWEAQCMAQGSL